MDGFLINFDSDCNYKVSTNCSNFEVSQIVSGENIENYFDKMQKHFPSEDCQTEGDLFGWSKLHYHVFNIEKV